MIQDWSPVFEWLERFRQSGEDLGTHLDENPGTVVEVFGLVEIVAANRAYLAFEGLEPGTPAPRRFNPSTIERAWQRYRDHLIQINQGNFQKEWLIDSVTRSGRPIHVRVHAAEHPHYPDVLLVTMEDFTAMRDARRAIEAANRSRDELVAAVAHELRTPMTAVVGFSSELETRSGDMQDTEVADLVSIVASQSRELAAMVEDLLVVARLGRSEFALGEERVDLAAAVFEVVDDLADDRVTVSGTAQAIGDAARIRQVVRNLVQNGRRHGGPNVRVVLARVGERAMIEVRDDGAPIPRDMLARMFEPYVRAPGERRLPRSAGLGLTVARNLAERMGGSLVARRDGSENVFMLELDAP